MKRLGWFSGIVGVLGVIGTAACTSTKAGETTPAPGASPAAVQVGSTVVDCGPGQRLLLMQSNGVTQVRCTSEDATQGPLVEGTYGSDGVQPYVVNARVPSSVQDAPVAARPAAAEPRRSTATSTRRASSQGRTWKKSAVIIGGSTAAGAGVGAIMGGGDGAKKGAVVGMLGGVVYDIATRDR
jgi:hypothetical protein